MKFIFSTVISNAPLLPSFEKFFLQMSSTSSFSSVVGRNTFCFCRQEARVRTSWTVDNPGRRFFGLMGGGCNFFKWLDDLIEDRSKTLILSRLKEKRDFALKREKDTSSGKFYKNALIASWVFFLLHCVFSNM
ncbi:hypothetical protein ACS0TY_023309 [Phlomoides rotata]